MAIIGNIIKGVIEARDALSKATSPVEEQKKVLIELLGQAKDTQFGKQYDFATILKSDDPQKTFAEAVPYHDYNKITDEWWNKTIEGKPDITWPGSPDFFALSSGTTGKNPKRIPVTKDMLDSITRAGRHQVFAMSNFDMPADFFEKEIMMLGSSTNLQERGGKKEGEISGISASNIPFWFKKYYKPGDEIAKIDDWDERVLSIAKNAKNWDIGALSGIPSWMELMLKKVIDYHNVDNIHEIWPNLQAYTSGGVAFDPYEKSFNALLDHPIQIIDTYLASEGFFACQNRPGTSAMKLITDNGIYFEFVPFEPEYVNQDGSLTDNAPSITLEDVEKDKDYVLIISTVSGAWRYIIGDTIAFTDVKRAEIKITGRTKFFLNTVGSQLSLNKLNDAVKHLEKELNIKVPEYTLCAKRFDDGFYHSWYLGSDKSLDEEKTATVLDNYLKEANKNYKVARSKALEGVKVNFVPQQIFTDWNGANKKKGGQVKMERVMGEDRFKEWEDFISKQS
ncbi:GH3 family domain-containing protein [Flagellimonas halotolerans]|uniref:GH3 auxin-responsive promoter family protein n=1 Tax=Flagellimonas halotolerans TaxID=3112164 RepID=A0ABU6INL4_9FLAO|nr:MULTISPECIES: GH3 auxin-responsive promoter family protein [unclassified Allomuricauda]MEC3964931.1 GH3 auxin-responsive promoter family protein [Muricauda sp. SYSU M86414]MEC4264705.1 GH3 auxin-responsive promoter family protein [Muricauda sp. SYSU M84420]